VEAPQHEQALVGRLAQPQAERHGPALEVVRQPPVRLHLGLLDDVRRVHARPQPPVHPQLDDRAQVGPVQGEEPVERLAVAGANAIQ
jgi:hypothetical protein